jgi:hypothetical protein
MTRRCACFETPSARAPQHDELFYASLLFVILRSGARRVSKDAICATPLSGADQ